MRLGIDAMGGDYAPEAVVEGVVMASKLISKETTIVLFGDANKIEELLSLYGYTENNVEIVPTTEVITMSDHPAQAFSTKPNSSITVGFNHLKSGKIDGFASAGSTGAMMVGCMFVVKQIEGIIRPTIATTLPTIKGNDALLLDVGLNVDCKPEVLHQYGIIGSIYSREILSIDNPRVGLLNIGEEKSKGNAQTKAAYAIMEEVGGFNFVGNVETKSLFLGTEADVFVCDGFVGNVLLKQAECVYSAMKHYGVDNPIMTGFNYENVGGTPVLGVNECVIIGHGCSSPLAIQNMILQTEINIKSEVTKKIRAAFN